MNEGKLGEDGLPVVRPTAVSLKWVLSFVARTPSLKLAPARVIEKERSENSTKEEISRYVSQLVALFAQHDYDPSN